MSFLSFDVIVLLSQLVLDLICGAYSFIGMLDDHQRHFVTKKVHFMTARLRFTKKKLIVSHF